ncbi:MAG: tyrosine--tRNA ligase [Candidatus Shapirobacteria bacterium]|nr:tyrosine--tRNA ligase [Candidatus Shapirobacteria bacterium]MDD5481666.1 tyrosine--tRNA ligase [Candidatus Shapirobacteria bacterium]
MNDFFGELKERGFVAQITNTGIEKALDQKGLTFYLGLDPTADSLHIGHIVPIMLAAHLQKMGHKPIILVGGATGLIGDPSEKDRERPLLSKSQVEKNVVAIKGQVSRLLSFDGKNSAQIVNNADWLVSYRLIDFLRDIGKHFTINELLGRESIKQRLTSREQGISFTEFSYMMLQAADYLELFQKYNCRLQIGGTDQWGNIIAGVDLIKRKLGKVAHALVVPLLTRSDGKKFGKTEAGAVWLDPDKTSPYQMYQYWLNVADEDAVGFLKMFTFLPLEQIRTIANQAKKDPGQRLAQKALACEFVSMIHGDEELAAITGACQLLFGEEKDRVSDKELACLCSAAPQKEISQKNLDLGLSIDEAVVLAGLAGSKKEARRLIDQGGVYLNNRRCRFEEKITKKDFISGKVVLLRAGKKRYSILVLK